MVKRYTRKLHRKTPGPNEKKEGAVALLVSPESLFATCSMLYKDPCI